MRTLAAAYLDHFDIELGPNPSVELAGSAPADLRELEGLITDLFGPGKLLHIFEALSTASETDFPHLESPDEKVCPPDVYFVVLDFLGTRIS